MAAVMNTAHSQVDYLAPTDYDMDATSDAGHPFQEDEDLIDVDIYDPGADHTTRNVNEDQNMVDDGFEDAEDDDAMEEGDAHPEIPLVPDEDLLDVSEHEDDDIDLTYPAHEGEVGEEQTHISGPAGLASQPAPLLESTPQDGHPKENTAGPANDPPIQPTSVPDSKSALQLTEHTEPTREYTDADHQSIGNKDLPSVPKGPTTEETTSAAPINVRTDAPSDSHDASASQAALGTKDASDHLPAETGEGSVPSDSRQRILIEYCEEGSSEPTNSYLFPTEVEETPFDGFLDDAKVMKEPLKRLLELCRAKLLSEDDTNAELVMSLEDLGLSVGEDNPYASQCCLKNIADLYLRLHRNEGNFEPEPLYLKLSFRSRFYQRFSRLLDDCGSGKGYTDVAIVADYHEDGHEDQEDFADVEAHEEHEKSGEHEESGREFTRSALSEQHGRDHDHEREHEHWDGEEAENADGSVVGNGKEEHDDASFLRPLESSAEVNDVKGRESSKNRTDATASLSANRLNSQSVLNVDAEPQAKGDEQNTKPSHGEDHQEGIPGSDLSLDLREPLSGLADIEQAENFVENEDKGKGKIGEGEGEAEEDGLSVSSHGDFSNAKPAGDEETNLLEEAAEPAAEEQPLLEDYLAHEDEAPVLDGEEQPLAETSQWNDEQDWLLEEEASDQLHTAIHGGTIDDEDGQEIAELTEEKSHEAANVDDDDSSLDSFAEEGEAGGIYDGDDTQYESFITAVEDDTEQSKSSSRKRSWHEDEEIDLPAETTSNSKKQRAD